MLARSTSNTRLEQRTGYASQIFLCSNRGKTLAGHESMIMNTNGMDIPLHLTQAQGHSMIGSAEWNAT